jgi:hypothetical protein
VSFPALRHDAGIRKGSFQSRVFAFDFRKGGVWPRAFDFAFRRSGFNRELFGNSAAKEQKLAAEAATKGKGKTKGVACSTRHYKKQ